MGDVAASGGYFVSMGADAIVAEPGTLTGSIGVVAGKQVIDRLVERFGIGHDGVAEGNHALMFSSLRAFSDEEWQRLDAWLDRIYEDFTGKVATGRRLPVDRLDDIACGRVWTGADAKEHGLVDELGGLRTALDLARRAESRVRGCPAPGLSAYRWSPGYDRPSPATTPAASARLAAEAWGPIRRAGGTFQVVQPRATHAPGDYNLSGWRTTSGGGEAGAHRPGSDLGAAGHPQLGQDVGDVHRRRARGDVQAASKLELLSPSASNPATSRSRRLSSPSVAVAASRRCSSASTSARRHPGQRSSNDLALVARFTGLDGAALRGQGAGEPEVHRCPHRRVEADRHVAGSAVEKGDDLGVVGGGAGDECSGCHLVVLREVVRLRRLEGREYVARVDAGRRRADNSGDDLLLTVQGPGLLEDFGEPSGCRCRITTPAGQHQVL